MKKTFVVWIALALILSFTCTSSYTLAEDSRLEVLSDERRPLIKDETVYVKLYHDGSISSINMVNRIETAQSGIYVDKGRYEEIINLTGKEEPSISGSDIIWQLPAREEGFYYQATLLDGELPFNFEITYQVDGVLVNPEELVGKAGRVEMKMKVISNNRADAYFRENYLCQIQLPLNLDISANISSDGASAMIVGRTMTLAYTVLPKKSADYTVRYDTSGFEFGSVTITSLYFDDADLMDIDIEDLDSGLNALSEGAGRILSGTEALKGGMGDLSQGIVNVSAGANELNKGADTLRKGIYAYADGVRVLSENLDTIDKGLIQLSEQGAQLVGGYSQLSNGLFSSLESIKPLLAALPEEEQVQYVKQLALLKEQMGQFENGLAAYSGGVSQSAAGVHQVSQGMSELSAKGKSLKVGSSSMHKGTMDMAAGLRTMSRNIRLLPDDIQRLIEGQRQLKDGIDEAYELFDAFGVNKEDEKSEPVSFASQEVKPRSTQFIMTIPELKAEKAKVEGQDTTREDVTLWDRILRLFRRVD